MCDTCISEVVTAAAVGGALKVCIARHSGVCSEALTKWTASECLLLLLLPAAATGGPGMVKAAYESGHPSIGVGAGNTPAVIDASADVAMAVSSILISKTFGEPLMAELVLVAGVLLCKADAGMRTPCHAACWRLSELQLLLTRLLCVFPVHLGVC
jgi:hypothetical protein